jgi:hypothetical protein
VSEGGRPVRPVSAVPHGWIACPPAHAPAPTAWPALFAFGIALLLWGLVSSFVVSLVGGALLFHSLFHWIGEIAHDAK